MSLYLWINLISISVPFLVSFDRRIKLYKHWGSLFAAIIVAMTPYIIWDVYFTQQGFWGFNPTYLSGIYLFDLPLGEWLFFVCIPYACVFTHISILAINPNLKFSSQVTNIITYGLLTLFFCVLFLNTQRAYTSVDMLFAIAILILVNIYDSKLLRSYYITFLFMLIPFFIVNGVLTGSGIVNEIVWYNDGENLGIRLNTIPIEDTVYAFSLILLNLFLFERFKLRASKL